jgi:hypothetical protein
MTAGACRATVTLASLATVELPPLLGGVSLSVPLGCPAHEARLALLLEAIALPAPRWTPRTIYV